MTIAEANAIIRLLRHLLDPDNVIPAERAAEDAASLTAVAQRSLVTTPAPDEVRGWVEERAARLRDAEAERNTALAEVERLRAQRNDAVATVAELVQRLTTREREHNADRALMEQLRTELADLQGQNALTEHHFNNYVDDAIREQNTLCERVAVAERDAARWRRIEPILTRADRREVPYLDIDGRSLTEIAREAETPAGWDDGTCGDCATGRCHGTDPDDCDCDRHNASVEATP